jgi:uncharacterized protein
MKDYTGRQILMGRLDHGADLLEEITKMCRAEKIRMGRVEAIGAVSGARLGFYNQTTREYQFFVLEEALEILSLSGNVSEKDGDVMVHAHVVLSDEKGRAFGGHLAPGTTIFACECLVEVLDGPVLERSYDEPTGLPLWRMPS